MRTWVDYLLTGEFLWQVAFLPSDPVPERVRRECRAECDVCTPGSPTRAVGQQAPFMTSSRHALDEAGWVKRQVLSCAQHVYSFVDRLIVLILGRVWCCGLRHVLLQHSMDYELIWAELWCCECGETAKSPPCRGAIGNLK